MKNYQAIIFDLGDVVINISFNNIFDYWAKMSGRDANELKQKFKFDEVYQQFERGEIKPFTYRKYISKKLGLHISEIEFDNGWNNIYLNVTPGIEQLLQGLKTKFRLIALTNTNEIHIQKWKVKYATLLSNFEKVFSSCEIRARKPEKKAYEIVLHYLKTEPKSVVLLDDNAQNVKTASAIGIKGVLVNSPHQMIDELKRLGIF